jgi:hypothetical protein
MTEGINVTPGSGAVLAADPCTVYSTAVIVPQSKIGYGGQGSYTDVSTANPLPVSIATKTLSAQTTLQSAAAANGNGTVMPVAGYDTAVLQITGTFVANVNFEVTADGSTWTGIEGIQPNENLSGGAVTGSSDADWVFAVAGFTSIRARISSYVSGSVTVIGFAEMGGAPAVVLARTADGLGLGIGSTSGALNVQAQFSGSNADTNTGNAGANTLRVAIAKDSGKSTKHFVSANSNNATSLKASAGTVFGVQVFNNSANIAYLKFYNKASAPSPASDTPYKVIGIPANTSGAGSNVTFGPDGLPFSTGIAYALVGGIGDTDNTSVAANAYLGEIDWE